MLITCLSSWGQVSITMQREGDLYVVPCKVNGLPLKFIFDTGASDVHLSYSEYIFMLKNGYIKENDIIGKESFVIANGDITDAIVVTLREVEIAGIKLHNVTASVDYNLTAPLLLGQSALQKLGEIKVNGNILTIVNAKNNKFDYSKLSPNAYRKSEIIADSIYPCGLVCGNGIFGDCNLMLFRTAITQQYTIVDAIYYNKEGKDYVYLDKDIYLIYVEKSTKKVRYVKLIKAENIAISPNKTYLMYGKELCFRLYFPKVNLADNDFNVDFNNSLLDCYVK